MTVVCTLYEGGAIRTPDKKLVAFYDGCEFKLYYDRNKVVNVIDSEHAMDIVGEWLNSSTTTQGTCNV